MDHIGLSGPGTVLSSALQLRAGPCLGGGSPGHRIFYRHRRLFARKQFPAGPEWLHEIKHDGYRLIVHRDGARVRLFTRNGHDWTARYPLIVEAALRNRQTSFVIDGEAVLLGVDGVSDFNGLALSAA